MLTLEPDAATFIEKYETENETKGMKLTQILHMPFLPATTFTRHSVLPTGLINFALSCLSASSLMAANFSGPVFPGLCCA